MTQLTENASLREQRRYVEAHHIDVIPDTARHGKTWHQFAFWWGGNANVFNLVLGAVVVSIGLTFWWALIAIAAGSAGHPGASRFRVRNRAWCRSRFPAKLSLIAL